MKNVLVTAGGTATAWHISNIAKEYFDEKIRIIICDINPSELVPSSLVAAKTFRVPYSNSKEYPVAIEKIISENAIDAIIPLIPEEALYFYKESDIIRKYNLFTTIPSIKTINMLADKKFLYDFLKNENIPTPELSGLEEVDLNRKYIIKPRMGFGSIGVEVLNGREVIIKSKEVALTDNFIIQEYCKSKDYDEITIEVFHHDSNTYYFARRRLDVKSGVCVKMEPVDSDPFKEYIYRITKDVECPIAFNLQFLRDNGEWKLFDFNLRLPAGTALSTALGFQLTRALLSVIAEEPVTDSLFEIDNSVKYVLRTYQELVVR